ISSHGEASGFFVTFLDNHDQHNRFRFVDPANPDRYDGQVAASLACLFSLLRSLAWSRCKGSPASITRQSTAFRGPGRQTQPSAGRCGGGPTPLTKTTPFPYCCATSRTLERRTRHYVTEDNISVRCRATKRPSVHRNLRRGCSRFRAS